MQRHYEGKARPPQPAYAAGIEPGVRAIAARKGVWSHHGQRPDRAREYRALQVLSSLSRQRRPICVTVGSGDRGVKPPYAEPTRNPLFPSLGLFRHVGEEYELYKAILWTPGIDLFIKHLQTSLSHRIEQGFQENGRKFEIPIPVLASFIAGSFLTLLKWWLENKMVHSPEEMDGMFKKLTIAGIESLQTK